MVNYKKFFIISLIISVISALAIILLTTNTDTIEALKQVRPEYIVLAILLHVLSYILLAKKTKFLLRSLGYQIRTKLALENMLTGILLASLTPASIGGEPVRILLLRKNAKVPVGKATAVIFMERFLDVFFVLICLIPSMSILRIFLKSGPGEGVWGVDTLLYVGTACLIILLAALIYAIINPEFVKKLVRKILVFLERKAPEKYKPRIQRTILVSENEIDLFRSSFKRFISVGKFNLITAIGYTTLYWIIRYSILWMILLGLNITPNLGVLVAAQIVLSIIMIIPATPGSSGIAEIAALTLFSLFVPSSLVGVVVISWRAITYYMNIIVGSLASFRMIRKYGVNAFSMSKDQKEEEEDSDL